MVIARGSWRPAGVFLALVVISLADCLGCAQAKPPNPNRYRLMESGSHWDVAGDDHVFDDIRPNYPAFFEVILDPTKARAPNLRTLRDDLERVPVDRRNYNALNALAIAYYETNYRAESGRGDGFVYLALSQRSAKLLAVPWRAYGETDDPDLRNAILDFFEDAGSGEKLETELTAPRLTEIVRSLKKKEDDPTRRDRIDAITRNLQAKASALEGYDEER